MAHAPLPALLLVLYLLPCALQDLRTRHVSNWLTVPAFLVAWPLALWLGTLPFTFAVFAGCYVAWRAGGMGPADGKLAVIVAAVSPDALLLSAICAMVASGLMRLRLGHSVALPGAVFLFIGELASVALYSL